MKKSKILLLLGIVFFSFVLFVFTGVAIKAAGPTITLTPLETEGYVSHAAVEIEVDGRVTSGKNLRTLCFASGVKEISYFNNCDATSMKLDFNQTSTTFVYKGEFMANLNGDYTVYASTYFNNEESVAVITINNVDATADTIVLTQGKVNDELNNVLISIEITNVESEVEEVKYMVGRRSLDEIRNYGTVLEDYSQLVANKVGYYTFYSKDKAMNESIAYIKVSPSLLVNGNKKISINQASQKRFLVKEKEGIYYIELPKQDKENVYPKNKVMIISTYDEGTNTYNVIENTQGFSQYLVIEGDTYSALKKDRVIVKVDPSAIGTYSEGETYVYAAFVSKKQARAVGFNVTLRNFNFALIAVGIVAVVFILFIITRLRVKRFSAN